MTANAIANIKPERYGFTIANLGRMEWEELRTYVSVGWKVLSTWMERLQADVRIRANIMENVHVWLAFYNMRILSRLLHPVIFQVLS